MLPALIVVSAVGLIAAYAINWYICFRRNIKIAKESGIPYIVVPVYYSNQFWLITYPIWLKLARTFLPTKWVQGWHDYTLPELPWRFRHEAFRRQGTDTLLTVSGGGFVMFVADADVISQITTRRNDFPKMVKAYTLLNIYGKNVVTTEGSAWRRHRKLTSPPFTEKNNQLVWTETLDQTQAMLDLWLGKDRKGNRTVWSVMDDTLRLSLHLISRAGFGQKLAWPIDEEVSEVKSEGQPHRIKTQNMQTEIGEGHSMSYFNALHRLLTDIVLVVMLNHWVLRWSPSKAMRHAHAAYVEWGKYMREMIVSKRKAIELGKDVGEKDILGQLVKEQVLARDEKSSSRDTFLSDSEILGNAFIFIVAGHETTANSIHFAILLLALNISSQRRLQKDLEDHFQGRPTSEWDYDRDLPALFGGMTGAVMNEQLRLIPPVILIPKSTHGVGPQPLTVNGKRCTVPDGAYIPLCSASVHRNPKWWPHGPPQNPKKPAPPSCNHDNAQEEFKPERWLRGDDDNGHVDQGAGGVPDSDEAKTAEAEDLGINPAATTAASLYRPPKGAFIAFSEGFRACLGRRFAQVEVLAALAAIFSQYSAELAVDKYASDEEIDRMNQEQRAEVWEKAADEARDLINGSTTILTLQMRGDQVPIRFVRKGEERFSMSRD